MSTRLPRRTVLHSAGAAVVVVATGTVAACSTDGPDAEETPQELTVRAPGAAGAVDPAGSSPAAVTVAATRALLERASTVVVSSAEDADITAGAAAARRLGIPLLVDGPELAAELDRLGTHTVIRYAGRSPQSPDSTSVPHTFGERQVLEGPAGDALPDVPGLPLEPRTAAATVLLHKGTTLPPALAPLLHAVGATPLTVAAPDIRRSAEAREALRSHPKAPLLAVGAGFGTETVFAQRVRTTAHAPELPGGGLLPFPDRMMVALYGHPHTAALGMLGEQSAPESVARAKALADEYAALTDTLVVPAFELIATVASDVQGDGVYSQAHAHERAAPAGSRPPRRRASTSCSTCSRAAPTSSPRPSPTRTCSPYRRSVWPSTPSGAWSPTRCTSSRSARSASTRSTRSAAWLADLARTHDLPQKVLMLHQFRPQDDPRP